MAAANAQIGVASAAFYPSITLGADRSASRAASLDDAVRRAEPDLVARRVADCSRCSTAAACAPTSISRSAGYDATVANYRRVVLTAMQEVEDGITGLRRARARLRRRRAPRSRARARVLDLATARYEGGVATYLDVITAQQALLNAERQARAAAGPAAARRRCSW